MSRSSLGGSRRRSFSAASLPAISEDGITLVESPHASTLRSPCDAHFGHQTPPYTFEDFPVQQDWPGKLPLHAPLKHEPDRETAEGLRRERKGWFRRQLEKRGGWIRILIAFLVLMCLVTLGIGLGVGLSTRNSNDKSAEAKAKTSASQAESDKAFPEGTYRFETVLESISTDCTTQNSAYRCYPYSTYSEALDASMAVFDWIIEATGGESNAYQISSTKNPFSIAFQNATMNLTEAGTVEERFDFSVPLNMTVIPDRPHGSRNGNRASICYYSGVTFSASVYTRKEKSWPKGTSTATIVEENKTQNPRRWPYAATMKQSVRGKNDVPDCRDAIGNSLREFGRNETTEGGECSCGYTNFGL